MPDDKSKVGEPDRSLREARLPGAAAGLSQQDQMLIAAASAVTGEPQPRLPTFIKPAI
jgi:hypothetical protein